MARSHTLAAIFRNPGAASQGLRHLHEAGFEPVRVEVVGTKRRAAEIAARAYRREGLMVGLAIGVAFVLIGVFVLEMTLPPFEAIVVTIAVTGAWALIGLVTGGAIARRGPDAPLLEAVVDRGGLVVAVECTDDCEAAERALSAAGAADVRDETPPAL